jgi:peptidoglycan/LPS O-acetylase OafA/YrhL
VVFPAIYRRIESWLLSTTQEEPLLRRVMPELDSIRGIAILMVLVYHAFYWRTNLSVLPRVTRLFVYATWPGRLGVNLFFVLSGFLITGLLVESAGREDYFKRFYVRRVLRILPVYYGILLILAVTHQASGDFLGLSAIYLSNLTPMFGIEQSYVVLWSLAVEEHFYLIWPAVVRRLTQRRLLYLSGAIVLAAPAVRAFSYVIASRRGSDWVEVAGYTWNAADALALGCFLTLALREFHWDRRTTLRVALGTIFASAAFFWAGVPFGIMTRTSDVFGAALQEVPWNFAFAGLVALFLVLGTGNRKALAVPRMLRFFGRISYGLYLVHILIFSTYDAIMTRYSPGLTKSWDHPGRLGIRFLVASAAAVLLAWISRETFEEFFLSRKEGWCGKDSFHRACPVAKGRLCYLLGAAILVDLDCLGFTSCFLSSA